MAANPLDRDVSHGGVALSTNPVWTIRAVFLVLLFVLILPSRLLALAHGANPAMFLGATTSTLIVWMLLYRLCLGARRGVWFVAAAIPALFTASFSRPVYAWCVVFVLYIVHRYTVGRSSLPAVRAARAAIGPSVADERSAVTADGRPPIAAASWMRVVDLDPVCTPYRRLLFSLRLVRAAAASLAGSILVVLVMLPWFMYELGAILGPAAAVVMVLFLGLVGALSWLWLRGVWTGSVMAGIIGVIFTAMILAVSIVAAIVTAERDLLVTGGVWFYATGHGLQLTVLGLMGMGSAVVVARRHDPAFMGMLRQNAGRDWRVAMQQLGGVIMPDRLSLRGLAHPRVMLSTLAFAIEGAAFYVYFRLGGRLAELRESPLPYPGPLPSLEGHYLSIVTILCFALPVAYVSTQITLALADRIRNAARRASLRPAEDILKEDCRAPVLFLRDFEDDQVSLERAALPAWARIIDPGLEQANLEDVLQACLDMGPAVAIGRPWDVAPPVGSARRYLYGENWQEVVLAMMDAARVVIVGVSDSAGVSWEIDQLRNRGHLGKSTFAMPPTRRRSARLAVYLLAKLQPVAGPIDEDQIAAAVECHVGARHVVAVTVRHGMARIFVTGRRPSQVEFDAALRLALDAGDDAGFLDPQQSRIVP